MRRKIVGTDGEMPRLRPLAKLHDVANDRKRRRLGLFAEDQRRLTAADQLYIDLGEKAIWNAYFAADAAPSEARSLGA